MSKPFSIGPFRLRPHKRDGKLTGQWLAEIPPSLAGGKRVRRFFDNRRKAEQFAKQMDRAYRNGRLDRKSVRDVPNIGFQTAVDRWMLFQQTRVETYKKRKVSLDTDSFRLKSLLSFFGETSLSDFTEERIAQYQLVRLGAGKRSETVNSEIRVLATVLRWAHKKSWLQEIPTFERIPIQPSEQAVPSPEETVRIINELPDRLRPLVRFIAETGCRSGEAFNLTWDDVDEVNGVITFRPNGEWTPKTLHSHRRVFVGDELLSDLRRLPKKGKYVFPGKVSGKPIGNIRKAFATAVAKAQINRNGRPLAITPKTLRKAYATWLAMQNVPQRILQANLGHAAGSSVTNQYYVQAQESERRDTVIELPITATHQDRTENKLGNNLATGPKRQRVQKTTIS